jgi:hypothetical protein
MRWLARWWKPSSNAASTDAIGDGKIFVLDSFRPLASAPVKPGTLRFEARATGGYNNDPQVYRRLWRDGGKPAHRHAAFAQEAATDGPIKAPTVEQMAGMVDKGDTPGC